MHSYNHCGSEEAISITYSGFVFLALSIQHAMRVRHTVIYDLSVPTIFYDIISQTARFSKSNVTEHIKCFVFLCNFFWHISHCKKNSTRCHKWIIGLHLKCSLFLSDFNETWILSTDFRKIFKCQFSWESVLWEPSYYRRTEGRTDRWIDRHNKANSCFSQFCHST